MGAASVWGREFMAFVTSYYNITFHKCLYTILKVPTLEDSRIMGPHGSIQSFLPRFIGTPHGLLSPAFALQIPRLIESRFTTPEEYLLHEKVAIL